MKEKIRKIHGELNDGKITVSQATEQVLDLLGVSSVSSEWDLLDEEEGSGPYCCGKRMVDRGIMLVCLNCDAEENSSS